MTIIQRSLRQAFCGVILLCLLYSVPALRGQVTVLNSFPLTDASVNAMLAGPDGNIWFVGVSSENSAVIGCMPLTGTPNENSNVGSYPSSYPMNVTAGPDGNIWFTDGGTNSIGKVTIPPGPNHACPRTAQVTEFAIPTQGTSPSDITAGSDGALWFTDQGANGIGRVTTSGAFSEEIPVPNSEPGGIATGPDGDIWFTEFSSNKIGQIDPNKRILVGQYSIPTNNSGPAIIKSGTDHTHLWFAEWLSGKLGQISTTDYAIQDGIQVNYGFALDIMDGPDKAMWFLTSNSKGTAYLGRVTSLTGKPTYFSFGGWANSIASGPDGALWLGGSPNWIGQAIPVLRRNGIDLSNYSFPSCPIFSQAVSQLRGAGVNYAVVKAPQPQPGELPLDCKNIDTTLMAIAIARKQLDELSAAGITTAAYCYLHFDSNAETGTVQAGNCLKTVGSRPISFMALDVEDWPQKPAPLQQRLDIISAAIAAINAANLPSAPAIYTARSYWSLITNDSKDFSSNPLWVAAVPPDFELNADRGGNYRCFGAPGLLPTLNQGNGIPSLSSVVPFDGWTEQSVIGNQFDIGFAQNDQHVGECLFGVAVDFDEFAAELFQ